MSISSRLLPSAVAGALLVALAGCGSGARPEATLTQAPAVERPTAAAGNVVLPEGASQGWERLRGRGFKSSALNGVGIGRSGSDRATDSTPFNSDLDAYMRNEDASSSGDLDFFLLWALDGAAEGGADLDGDNAPDAAPVFVAPGTRVLRNPPASVISDDGDDVKGEEEADWLARKGRATGVAGVDLNPLDVGEPEVDGHGSINWLQSIETSGTGSFGWKDDGYRYWRDEDNEGALTRHLLADNGLRFFNSRGAGAGQDGAATSVPKIRTTEALRLYVKDDGTVVTFSNGSEREIAAETVAGLGADVDLILNDDGTVQAVRHGSVSWQLVEGYETEEKATVNADGHLVIDDKIQVGLQRQDADPDSAAAGTVHFGVDGGLRVDGVEVLSAAKVAALELELNENDEVVDKNGRVLIVGLEADKYRSLVLASVDVGGILTEAITRRRDGAVYHQSRDDGDDGVASSADLTGSVEDSLFINEDGLVFHFHSEEERILATGTTAAEAKAGRGFVEIDGDSTRGYVYDVVSRGNEDFERIRADIARIDEEQSTGLATSLGDADFEPLDETDEDFTQFYVDTNGWLINRDGKFVDKDGKILNPDSDDEVDLTNDAQSRGALAADDPVQMGEYRLEAEPIVGTPLEARRYEGEGVDAKYLTSVALKAADGQIIILGSGGGANFTETEATAAGITRSRNDSTLIHYDVEVLYPVIEGSTEKWSIQYSNFALVRASRKDSAGESLTGANSAPDYFLNAFTFVRKDQRTPSDWFETNDGATNDVELTYNTRLAGWGRSGLAGAGGSDDDIFLLTGNGELKATFGRNGGGTVGGAFDTSIYETKAEAGRQFRDGRDWRKVRMDNVRITTDGGGHLQFQGGLTVDEAVSDAGDGAGADKGESAAYTGRINGAFAGPVAEELVGDFTLTTPTAAAPDFLGGIVGQSYEAPERATDSAN